MQRENLLLTLLKLMKSISKIILIGLATVVSSILLLVHFGRTPNANVIELGLVGRHYTPHALLKSTGTIRVGNVTQYFWDYLLIGDFKNIYTQTVSLTGGRGCWTKVNKYKYKYEDIDRSVSMTLVRGSYVADQSVGDQTATLTIKHMAYPFIW